MRQLVASAGPLIGSPAARYLTDKNHDSILIEDDKYMGTLDKVKWTGKSGVKV